MSRIGNNPINIPSGVTIDVSKGNLVTVKGKNGELKEQIHPELGVGIEDGVLSITRPSEQKRHKAMHGLSRALINNMVEGVTNGFTLSLALHGVGFRASNRGNILEMSLGYSHPVVFLIPDEISLETKTEKGKPPVVILSSSDKQLVGEVAAKIKALRKPEPYKGKGIRFVGEEIRTKEGKSAKK